MLLGHEMIGADDEVRPHGHAGVARELVEIGKQVRRLALADGPELARIQGKTGRTIGLAKGHVVAEAHVVIEVFLGVDFGPVLRHRRSGAPILHGPIEVATETQNGTVSRNRPFGKHTGNGRGDGGGAQTAQEPTPGKKGTAAHDGFSSN